MYIFLLRLVIVSNALALFLPPGHCCVTLPRRTADQPMSCCRHGAAHHEAAHKEGALTPGHGAPTDSPVYCCCHRDAVPTGEPALPDKLSASVVDSNVGAETSIHCFTARAPAQADFCTGPPRHVLQCVWLC